MTNGQLSHVAGIVYHPAGLPFLLPDQRLSLQPGLALAFTFSQLVCLFSVTYVMDVFRWQLSRAQLDS